MIATTTTILSAMLMAGGVLLSLIAGLGLQRFPDVFARIHAATKPATLGLAMVLLGAALRMNDAGSIVKLGLVLVLQLVTVSVGSHLVVRATYGAGTELSPETMVDELAGVDLDE